MGDWEQRVHRDISLPTSQQPYNCKQSATSGHFLIEEIRAVMLPVSWPLGRPDCTIFFARKSLSAPPYDVPI